ncbi:hypothetical protein AVEN_206220-1 [Araneus ventricosus]|uniref:Uncharacterized protein n=1 Tax=Araneus ventricosus TaxID=182803 RepID=A0A4Y2G780_ARAVE|nr:hypothetical protein AVEN_206220-1 [Araneus ventricosus]
MYRMIMYVLMFSSLFYNLIRQNIECLPHSPRSPNLAPCEHFLSPRLKSEVQGRHAALNDYFERGKGGSIGDITKWVPSYVLEFEDKLGQVYTT